MFVTEAIVEYDYDASEPDKLTLRKDDVVRDIVKKYNGWWEGTLRNKRGLFPAHLVQVTTRRKARHQCRALFSYEAEHNDELSLSVGDVIDVICEVEEGWWKGRLNGVEGVFPSNFVTTIELDRSSSKEELNNRTAETDSNLPNLPPKPTRITCRVKYPYDACNDDELTLREGDIITLLSKDGQDSGWWKGELNGRIGVFPDNFVVVLPNAESAPTNNVTSATGAVPSTSTSSKIDKKSDKSLSKVGIMSVDEPSVASQRRTIELKGDEHKMPPVPGKKPSLPKKTTAATNMKQRMTHVVDGAAPSRPKEPADTDFDQVERSGMLSDMRATRARGPGRRPPSAVYRDTEAGLVNGNSDHVQAADVGATDDADDTDKKRKVHEWQKHKAPWVEELKMNQARRTPPPAFGSFSVSTAPTQNNDISRIRLTPPYESISPMEVVKSPKPDNSPIIPSESTKTRHSCTDQQEVKTTPSTSTSTSPLPISSKDQQQDNKERPNITMTNSELIECVIGLRERLHRLEILAGIKTPETSNDQVNELAERVERMEVQVTRLHTTVEELRTKLKVESDLRRMLQAKLDKVEQCVTQV